MPIDAARLWSLLLRNDSFKSAKAALENQIISKSVIVSIGNVGLRGHRVGHCLKCEGALRYDWEFPGLVCQRCGVVYYFNPCPKIVAAEIRKERRGGWHQIKAAD